MGQPLTDKHILIVEDEAVFRSVIAGYLTSLGASVCEAVNGVDALAVMQGYHPDLIVCDLKIPLMGGYYHRGLQRLILISAGLHAMLNAGEEQLVLNNGIPLGTLDGAYLNQLNHECAAFECQVWGRGGRLRLMLSAD